MCLSLELITDFLEYASLKSPNEAISTFLSDANPNLPKDAVSQLITEHVTLLKEAVDKHGAGDFAGSYDAQDRARTQITTKIADTLSGAIVKQSPEKF